MATDHWDSCDSPSREEESQAPNLRGLAVVLTDAEDRDPETK